MVDRRGRFLDSIADIIINLLVFMAISYSIYSLHGNFSVFILGFFAFLSLTLRVSYFVFYLVSYLKLEDKMKMNRTIEIVTEEDKKGDKLALILQYIFNFFYTWQDMLIYYIDKFSKPSLITDAQEKLWYSDKTSLRLNNFIGLGTELTLLILMTYLDFAFEYLVINVSALNLYLITIIFYRKFILAKKIMREENHERENRR
mgnify:FL=1